MKKAVFWIGVYGICVKIHDILEFADHKIKRMVDRAEKNEEKKKNRSKNLSTGEVGDPIDRIGF